MKKSKDYIGEFEELVLLAVLKLGENAYGVRIHDAIEEATNRSVSIGALYTTLSRLESKGLVHSRESEPSKERGGRIKRYYHLDASGQQALHEAESGRRKLANLANYLRERGLQPNKSPELVTEY
jgi:PadR family transcriptional regulator, regulatory protein PadR